MSDISCFGANDGSITVNVSGGTAPYSYNWADITVTPEPKDRTNLSAGNYSLIITDSKGCTFNLNATIAEGTRINKPAVIIHEATLCGTSSAPSLEVCSPTVNVTYILYDKNDVKKAEITPTAASPNVLFTNLVPGSGFKVIAKFGNCESLATVCGEEVTTCPQNIVAQTTTSSLKATDTKTAEDQLTAYPVPFSEKVTLEFKAEGAGNYVINLYDMKGALVRELKSGTAKAGEVTQIEVDGRMMADGMYLARMMSGSGTKTVKLLKKNR